MTPEQLISALQDRIIKLDLELQEANEHIRDFEIAAREWQKGYRELEKKHRIEIEHKNQIIDELTEDLKRVD